MPKKQAGEGAAKEADKHIFILKNKKKRLDIEIDYSPVKAFSLDAERPTLKEFSILPTFNFDHKHYSYAFFTPYDGLDNDEKLRDSHEKRVKEISTMIGHKSIVKTS